MKKRIFTGVGTALITPMNSDGSVNFDRLKKLVDEQIVGGVDSLIICGTTGEKSTLRYDEHIQVIKTAVNAAAGRVPIVAGTGSNDTVYSVELCNDAAEAGADAFLMVTPYYNKASQRGLVAHYNYVADRVSKPIILYNVPSRTGVNIKPETYKELSLHPNIVATKEASGDLSLVAKIKHLCGDELDIYSGNDDQTVPIMSLGGIGTISVLSHLVPRRVHNMCAACLNGDFATASKIQLEYISLIEALFSDVNPVPIKEAMNLMGLDVGPCRLPLYHMSDAARDNLKARLKECNLL